MTGVRNGTGMVLTVGLAWLAAAVVAGATGMTARLHPPVPQLVLFGLTVLLLAAGISVPPLRRWAAGVDLRHVVALHLTRFVGIYFLLLYRQGDLPYAFAVPGGWGDIFVATTAVALLALADPTTRNGRGSYLAWNTLGTIDILAVVATAAAQGMERPETMRAMQKLPLSLLATFLVPLIIASHVLIFARLLRASADGNRRRAES